MVVLATLQPNSCGGGVNPNIINVEKKILLSYYTHGCFHSWIFLCRIESQDQQWNQYSFHISDSGIFFFYGQRNMWMKWCTCLQVCPEAHAEKVTMHCRYIPSPNCGMLWQSDFSFWRQLNIWFNHVMFLWFLGRKIIMLC